MSDLLTSLGADCTRELLLRIVRWTGDASTGSLNVKEESTIIIIATAPRDGLSIFVYTFNCGSVVGVILSHEVAAVLQSPH